MRKDFISHSFQQPQNRFWRHLQFSDGTQPRSHILHADTKQIDIIVDNEEAVVVLLRQLYELDFTILSIVFLQVYLERLIVARVNRGFHIICSLVQQ